MVKKYPRPAAKAMLNEFLEGHREAFPQYSWGEPVVQFKFQAWKKHMEGLGYTVEVAKAPDFSLPR